MRLPQAALAAAGLTAALLALPARAVESCELNGQHVNPNNGNSTAGKTGVMRCRDGEGGPVVREQELQGGVFMGAVRYYSAGRLEKEYRVNERGNRDGVAREFAAAEGGGKPVLVREESYRDGRTIGLARSWYPSGRLRRVTFYDDGEREQAYAEFTTEGRLYELQCAPRPVLGSDADDAHWCGHVGGPSTVALYSGKGTLKARVSYERGERRKSELLGDDGSVRELQESDGASGIERTFYPGGAPRREVQWSAGGGDRARRITTVEREFHESGKLVHERRWRVAGGAGELALEQRWYLNGQPKERVEFAVAEGRAVRQETLFHDNGKKASEGAWRVESTARRGRALPTGVHRSWDEAGQLRGEQFFDERGRLTRERELDGAGAVVRDDEVFEDGSRKAYGR